MHILKNEKGHCKLGHFIPHICVWLKDVESYIHRSGRTGRAGRTGVCICFYQRKEEDQLRYVENKAVCCVELREIKHGFFVIKVLAFEL